MVHKKSMALLLKNRIDPSRISKKTLNQLAALFTKQGCVTLINTQGHRMKMPDELFQQLGRMVNILVEKRVVIFIPEDETLTTQAAANMLGMSRQHFVSLLDQGTIAFTKVGTHRRVKFQDAIEFRKKRDAARRSAMNELSDKIEKAGYYKADYTGECE
jgi:excisionase family DNA binding protein